MNSAHLEATASKNKAIALWDAMLRDEIALLKSPGIHHKAMLNQANALYLAQVIDRDELSDLLEQADGALAYAVEALFDRQAGE
jgi:hypothetical protein